MCGLAGYIGPVLPEADRFLKSMTDAIAHRGPDAAGHWYAEVGSVAGFEVGLGHRRLSIVELSEAGAQPMISQDGRYVIVFNGEIYNFHAMRAELDERGVSPDWRGHSDTQVLLAWIVAYGVESALERADGMFALALWDRKQAELTLARDAFGEKPLYWGLSNGRLLFGSELRALTAAPTFVGDLNHDSLGDFFKYSYVPAPATVWRGIEKLPSGHLVRITADDVARKISPRPVPWWDPVAEALAAVDTPFAGSEADAVAQTDALLLESVRRRLVSDVPLGAFLSGGIDSAMVTALMTEVASGAVKTFSIGMAEDGYDESPAAAAVADHLGTTHRSLVLSSAEVQEAIPTVAHIHDEPFADSSQLPTYLVSKMARSEVTVALSGDGGDEIFGGYNRYFHAPRVWNRFGGWPVPLRQGVARGLAAMPVGFVNRSAKALGPIMPRELAAGRAGEKIHKLARLLAVKDESAFHDRLLATADAPGTGFSRRDHANMICLSRNRHNSPQG